jgi:hypothetical protein
MTMTTGGDGGTDGGGVELASTGNHRVEEGLGLRLGSWRSEEGEPVMAAPRGER